MAGRWRKSRQSLPKPQQERSAFGTYPLSTTRKGPALSQSIAAPWKLRPESSVSSVVRVDRSESATWAAAQQSSGPFHCDVRDDDHPVLFLLRLLANPGSDLLGHDALQRQRAGGRRRLFMAGNAPRGGNGSNHAAGKPAPQTAKRPARSRLTRTGKVLEH